MGLSHIINAHVNSVTIIIWRRQACNILMFYSCPKDRQYLTLVQNSAFARHISNVCQRHHICHTKLLRRLWTAKSISNYSSKDKMLCATTGSSTSSMFKVQVFRTDLWDTAEELLMVASVSVISHLIFILHCLLITPLWLTVPERKYCGCYFYSTG